MRRVLRKMSKAPIDSIPTSTVGTLNQKQRRTRASKPKNRTGCKTCKLRRVKCDEAQPACLRCVNSGRHCDGYQAVIRHFKRQNVEFRSALHALRPIAPQISRGSWASLSLSPALSFRSDTDKLYFDSFMSDAMPKLACPAGHRLWNYILLQACHDEPWVFDSIIAIAALHTSAKSNQKRTNPFGLVSSDRHQQMALERYGQAITAMKLNLTNEERHVRKALIGCILVFIFECFQGHHKLAMLHVHSGYQMLRRWLASKSYGTPVSQIMKPRYNSLVVEQELVNLFTRLHLHTISTVREVFTSKSLVSEQEELDGDEILSSMPANFTEIEEAKRYIFLILKRAIVFFAVAADILCPLNDSSQTSEFSGQHKTSSADFDFAAMAHIPFQTEPLPNSVIAGHTKYASELARGQLAFNHLYTLPAPPSPVMMTYIQLAFDTIRIYLNSLIVTEECTFDEYLHEYRNLLLHIKQFLKVTPSSEHEVNPFSLEFGILPGLYLICKFCRDGQVRREAISLMRAAPRREGAFDRVLTARISAWVMKMEEEGMNGGHIPEIARIRVTGVDVNLETKSAKVRAVKRTDQNGGIVTLRTVINLEE